MPTKFYSFKKKERENHQLKESPLKENRNDSKSFARGADIQQDAETETLPGKVYPSHTQRKLETQFQNLKWKF